MPYRPAVARGSLAEVERRIKAAVYTPLAALAATAWVTPEPVPYARRRDGRELRLRPGDRWSEAVFDCAWFRFTGTVPGAAKGEDVVLLIDINGEGCVVDEAGRPRLGLTNVNSTFDRKHGEPGKRVVPFRAPAEGGESVEIWVEAGANDLFGERQDNGKLKEALVALRHPQPLRPAIRFRGSPRADAAACPRPALGRPRLREALGGRRNCCATFTDAEAVGARAILAPVLAARGGDRSLTISAVGHAHMDLAWLWPIRETIRKCARTFATTLDLMERYPDYVFGASQPQQYDWVKKHYPDLYARIKARVAEGRWEVQGAMWVEPDTNLPGGEVADPPDPLRQALLSRRIRAGSRLPVGARRVRLYGRAAADPGEVGRALFHDPETVVEPGHPAPLPYLLVGGHRRLEGARAHAARSDLQQRGGSALAPRRRTEFPRKRRVRPLPPAVRHRRWRRRAGRGASGAAGARGGPRRAVPGGAGAGDGLFRPYRRGRRALSDLVGRALPRTAPGDLHHPGPHQALQPQARTCLARARADGGHGRGIRRDAVPAGPARTHLERGAALSVPRHPAGLVDHPRL